MDADSFMKAIGQPQLTQVEIENIRDVVAAAKPDPENDATNPKDRFGLAKVSLSKVPTSAMIHEALAMADGARKYGPYNWREKKVIASIYVDACLRHLMSWFDGEERAADSGVHHLGHARACLGILLDALETDSLHDDRPTPGRTADLLAENVRDVK